MTSTVPLLADKPDWPAIPVTVDDLQLPETVISDLILRSIWLHGTATAYHIRTPASVREDGRVPICGTRSGLPFPI
ncbi:MAG: hypothetical protein ABI693_07095 [Bryobacteraceae bacterium]